jgi:hypothetical protein
MKKLGLVVMIGLGGMMLGGCFSETTPDVAYKRMPLTLAPADKLLSYEAAKDAVGLLRDSAFFNPGPFESVEVTPSSVTVSGFKTEKGLGRGLYYRGYSSAKSVFSEGRNQVSIWLADIAEITIEQREVFQKHSLQGIKNFKLKSNSYICQIVLNDGRIVPFRTSEESYARRVAAGFSFLTHKSVTDGVQYPLAGCFISGVQDAVVIEEQLGGPFDEAGIPLGAVVKSVDGKTGNMHQISDALDGLNIGSHQIIWGQLRSSKTSHSWITIGGTE